MLLASKLTGSGSRVELVTRTEEQARVIREQGLFLTEGAVSTGRNEELAAYRVEPEVFDFGKAAASSQKGGAGADLPDLVLLTVKQTSITEAMAAAVRDQLKPGSRLVCFQNGVGHIELLRRYIPEDKLLIAVTTEGALKHSPCHVEHTGLGVTWLGAPKTDTDGGNNEALVKKIQKLLQDAGFSVFLSNNITSKVWNKLLINAAINPITAIMQIRNGMLLELPAAMTLMRTLFEEGARVADKLNIELAEDLWEQLLEVCRRTANNRSSMLQDVLSRRPTEIDAITGGLLASAREAGIEIKTHNTMYLLLRAIEQQWETI
jgi:2-dehydropantoate 2-reductase